MLRPPRYYHKWAHSWAVNSNAARIHFVTSLEGDSLSHLRIPKGIPMTHPWFIALDLMNAFSHYFEAITRQSSSYIVIWDRRLHCDRNLKMSHTTVGHNGLFSENQLISFGDLSKMVQNVEKSQKFYISPSKSIFQELFPQIDPVECIFILVIP